MAAALSGQVEGTVIHDLGEDDRPALLCSDLHVPIDGGQVYDLLVSITAAAVAEKARLFLLGDLFDSYVSPAQLRVGVYRQVAEALRSATDAGVDLWILHGNRDFLIGSEFGKATGGHVVAGGIRCRLASRSTLLLHGDELCQRDVPYQRAKRWLRWGPTRWLARRLPLSLAMWVAERARRRSQRVTQQGDPARFAPTLGAVDNAFATGCEQLVFGHIHCAGRGRFVAGQHPGDYLVLPAFDQGGVGLFAAGEEIRFVQVETAGRGLRPVADPDPRTFE